MGVEMHHRDGLAAADLRGRARDGAQDGQRDRMIAADRDRPGARVVDLLEGGFDVLDREVVVHGVGQRRIADIVDRAERPGIDQIFLVAAPIAHGHVAHRAGPEMLVALGGAVARTVGHTDQRDIAVGGVGIVGAAEQGWDAVPVEVGVENCAVELFAHGRSPSIYGPRRRAFRGPDPVGFIANSIVSRRIV